MAREALLAADYAPRDVELARSACLTLATYLGDFWKDLVLVGGLVPTILLPTKAPGSGGDTHVGTKDLDLGIGFGLLQEHRYGDLVSQLKAADFEQDVTGKGKPANHRWRHRHENVMVDFMIAPSGEPTGPNHNVRVIDESLSAVFAAGLPLAFRDRTSVELRGKTLSGEEAARSIWVCGAGAFIVMKALAFRIRGHPKDAYDLMYVIQSYGSGYGEVAEAIKPLLDDAKTQEALAILAEDFKSPGSLGPVRAAKFLGREGDETYRADLSGAASEIVRLLTKR